MPQQIVLSGQSRAVLLPMLDYRDKLGNDNWEGAYSTIVTPVKTGVQYSMNWVSGALVDEGDIIPGFPGEDPGSRQYFILLGTPAQGRGP